MKRRKLSRWLILSFVGVCAFLLLAHSSSQAQPQAQQAEAQQLTVERIYRAPSLSGEIIRDTEWSPDGKSLAYIGRDDDNGEQEVLAVDTSTGRKRILVDGQQLRQILLPPASRGQQTGLGRITPPRFLWAPNSQALLFISAEQLFWYDLPSKTSHKLLATSVGAPETEADEIDDAKISPDGKWISFLRTHDVWIVNVATNQQQQITHGGTEDVRNGELDWVYPEELDLHTAYWWSPDSSRIAFLQLDERPVEKYPLEDFLSAQGGVTEALPGCRLAQSHRARGSRHRHRCFRLQQPGPVDGYRRRQHRLAGSCGLATRFQPRFRPAIQSRAESSGSALRRRRHRKIPDHPDRARPLLVKRHRRPVFSGRWIAFSVD